MRLHLRLLALPASILALLPFYTSLAHSTKVDGAAEEWPWNLPKHVKYWPEDPPMRRRDLEAIDEHVRQGRSPVGIMKMPADPGAKFYMEYWQFEEQQGQTSLLDLPQLRGRDDEEEAQLLSNASMAVPFKPPFARHTEDSEVWSEQDLRIREMQRGRSASVKDVLEKRQFVCPTGSSSCSAIGYPNSCCATGETCFAIQDTGLGPVGCCASGSTCGGSISSCNAPNTPCDASIGGGCCIPNYVCANPIGCVINPSLIVTVIVTQTFSQRTTVITSTSTSTPTTTSRTTTVCSSGFQSCPVSLGGGCCPTDQVCAQSSCATPSTASTTTTTVGTSSTASGVAPIRPTSSSLASVTTTTQSAATGTSCPTGFYACSAYYAGGCCQTGRDCQTRSCPPTSSTTIVSAGQTIVVPVGSAATVLSPTGACASGWSTCAASLGGDCCPSGFACGTASCTSISATATAEVQKDNPVSSVGKLGTSSIATIVGACLTGLFLL